MLIVIAIIASLAGGKSDDKAASTTTSAPTTSTTLRPSTTTTYTTTTTTPAPILTKDMCKETPVDGVLAKDGNAFTGQCLHFWANVFQFDAATGPCSLMAHYSNSYHRYNFEYGNTILLIDAQRGPGPVVSSTSGKVQLPPDSCVQLGPITQGDNIEVWGIALGTKTYSTKMGGSNQYLEIGLVDAYKR